MFNSILLYGVIGGKSFVRIILQSEDRSTPSVSAENLTRSESFATPPAAHCAPPTPLTPLPSAPSLHPVHPSQLVPPEKRRRKNSTVPREDIDIPYRHYEVP